MKTGIGGFMWSTHIMIETILHFFGVSKKEIIVPVHCAAMVWIPTFILVALTNFLIRFFFFFFLGKTRSKGQGRKHIHSSEFLVINPE
jgi:hypothetical protein